MREIKIYNHEQLLVMRQAGRILAEALEVVERAIKPGVSTLELNDIAHNHIEYHAGEPAFLNYHGYRHSICASVNEESIHGIPRSDKILCEGDIVSIDIGVKYRGMYVDAARTFPVGKVSDEARALINATRQAFFEGIRGLKAMSKVGDIGQRIEDYIKTNTTFSIIETYFGHGIGEALHEDPLIPNFRPSKNAKRAVKNITRVRLPAGCAIAIEPMINAGVKDVITAPDKWTAVTADGKLAAHYENTVIIKEDGVEVVTEPES